MATKKLPVDIYVSVVDADGLLVITGSVFGYASCINRMLIIPVW